MAIGTFPGGVHPLHGSGEGKGPTNEIPVRPYIPQTVVIPMGMHIGAPSVPCVAKGDHVKMGQVIGEPQGFLGLPVHASVSGEVIAVETIPYLTAQPALCVKIQNDMRDEWVENLTPIEDVDNAKPADIINAVKNAGICGMGGASFPTHVKLSVPEGKKCDIIVINGAECETHLTADYRLMIEEPRRIAEGVWIAMRAAGAAKAIIGIEDNKPKAITALREAVAHRSGITVQPLKTKYPQGGEKQLIQACTGRQVPSRKLPIDAGVIVLNVGTAAAIADAVLEGKPLISRITTVTGPVAHPANLLLRVGTLFQDAIDECDGFTEEPGKIIAGGAMMGVAAPNTQVPITKATNGINIFTEADASIPQESNCIRCARCVDACPTGLLPYQLRAFCDKNDWENARDYNVMDCTSCGSCSYICPARRILTSIFKNMKATVTAMEKGGAK